jgi:hypothetical protein
VKPPGAAGERTPVRSCALSKLAADRGKNQSPVSASVQAYWAERDTYIAAGPEPEPAEAALAAEAEWADEWDSADSNADQARVEARLEPEAGQ